MGIPAKSVSSIVLPPLEPVNVQLHSSQAANAGIPTIGQSGIALLENRLLVYVFGQTSWFSVYVCTYVYVCERAPVPGVRWG